MSGPNKSHQHNIDHLKLFGWFLVVVNESQRAAENISHDELCAWVKRNSRHEVMCEKLGGAHHPIVTWLVFKDELDAELCRWRWNHDE